jgi:hypothetical protein
MYLFFVLTIFVFPFIAAIYGGLALFIYNLIARASGWPELLPPWSTPKAGEIASIVSWYLIAGWLVVFSVVIALVLFYARR